MPKVIKNVHDRVGAQPYGCLCRSGGVKDRRSDGNTQLLKRGRDCTACAITSKGSLNVSVSLTAILPWGSPPHPSKKGCSAIARFVLISHPETPSCCHITADNPRPGRAGQGRPVCKGAPSSGQRSPSPGSSRFHGEAWGGCRDKGIRETKGRSVLGQSSGEPSTLKGQPSTSPAA